MSCFVDALEGLATQNEAQMKLKLLEIETSVKSKLNQTFCFLNQRRCRKEPVLEFQDECIEEEEEEQDVSTVFRNTKYSIDRIAGSLGNILHCSSNLSLQQRKCDIKLLKSYLLPLLVNERDIEPIVIKKANRFVSFKFGFFQLLDMLNFLGATSLDSFLKV